MRVRVLYFAVVRERLGRDEEPFELPAGATVATLLARLREEAPIAPLLPVLKVAVNEAFAAETTPLHDGDRVALIPPVAGGAGPGGRYRISDAPLRLEEVVDAVGGPAQGGLVTFTGVVREENRGKRVVALEYEAYRPMAERVLAEIGDALAAELPGVRVAIVHRVGRLSVGEAAVIIAAAAPHRGPAFAACAAAIDRLKASAPIWKKELTEDGEVWIGLGP